MQIDDTKSTKKRQSSEGVSNTAVEKKTKLEDIYLSEEPKEAVEEKVFSNRGGLHHEYVVPSNAGRTPIKVSVGASLKVSSIAVNRELILLILLNIMPLYVDLIIFDIVIFNLFAIFLYPLRAWGNRCFLRDIKAINKNRIDKMADLKFVKTSLQLRTLSWEKIKFQNFLKSSEPEINQLLNWLISMFGFTISWILNFKIDSV